MKKFTSSLILDLSLIPEPEFPVWVADKALLGVKTSTTFDLGNTLSMLFQDVERQVFGSKPSGHLLLHDLVSEYQQGHDVSGNVYSAQVGDDIHRHCGLKVLTWLEKHWMTLPLEFREEMKDKIFYGFADIVRDKEGNLCVPYFVCRVDPPRVGWYGLSHELGGFEYLLVTPTAEQVAEYEKEYEKETPAAIA